MTYSYKNGFREGVVFAFVTEGNKILIESRYNKNKEEVFFPSGSIEEKDHISKEDYILTALKREISEEFEDNIKYSNAMRLSDVIAHDINVLFYVFLITDWTGNFPDYIVEDGQKEGKLKWININEYERHFQFESAHLICKEINNVLFEIN